MPFYIFQWTEELIEHLGQHGVSPEEFQEVVESGSGRTISRSSGLPMAIGLTSTGKVIGCVWDPVDDVEVIPVTAYEITERQ